MFVTDTTRRGPLRRLFERRVHESGFAFGPSGEQQLQVAMEHPC